MKKTRYSRLRIKGFTLVELMAAGAVLGVLIMVATPNYLKQRRRALQNEAKVSLGSLYLIEQSLLEDQHSYSACYAKLMGNATGIDLYTVGFGTDSSATNACSPFGGGPQVACLAYRWFQKSGGGYDVVECIDGPGETFFSTTNPASRYKTIGNTTTQLSYNAFTALAIGDFGETLPDKWQVNEQKAIYQTGSGI